MIYLILSIFVVSYFECSCQECILSLHRDLPKKHEPLYFVQNGNMLDLFMPHMVGEDGVMVLQEGQQLVLACPGRNNKLTVSGAEATLSTCAGGIMLSIDNKIFPTYQLECENPVQALLQVTSEKCGCDKGTELRIGFHSPSGTILDDTSWFNIWRLVKYLWHTLYPKKIEDESSHWINLVTSCHIIKKSESLYSTHIIYGKTLAGAEVKWARPQFTRGNDQLYSGFNPDHFYKMKHQRHILLKLLGKKRTDIILQENFLSRGHLAPDADFLFGTWQYVTYFYANSAPQWLTINSGNWQHIERFIRHFAITSRSDLLITTGTHGILRLADSSGSYKKLYLHPEERQLPVPKYFWKVVLDPEKKACIAFICANNPFMRKAPTKLCRNICSYSGWPGYTENYAKGYIYCCEYQDLRNKIPTIPPIDCVSLLVGPKAFYNYRESNQTAAAG